MEYFLRMKMYNKLIAFLLFFSTQLNSFSNDKKLDSMYFQLKNCSVDTTKIKILNDIATEYIYSNPDSGCILFHEGLLSSEKISYLPGVLKSLQGIARSLWVKGDYPQSMEYAIKALKQSEQLKDYKAKVKTLNLIGLIYYEMTDFKSALNYYTKALNLELAIGDSALISRILGNIGDIHFHYGDTSKAHDYYTKALAISRQRKDYMNSSTNYLSLGSIYREKGNYQKAEDYLNNCLILAERVNDMQNVSRCLSGMASLYLKWGKDKKCLETGEKAIATAAAINDLPSIRDASEVLYELFERKRDYYMALQYFIKSVNAKNEMFNSKKNKEIARLHDGYELDKRQKEIELLLKDKKIAQQQLYFFAIGLILITALGIVIFISRQKQYKAKILVRQQKAEIEMKNDELNQVNFEIAAQRDYLEQLNSELAMRNDEIVLQKNKIEEIHGELTDSIKYAERIQTALLPSVEFIEESLTAYKQKFTGELSDISSNRVFVLFKPKDIVSGDFYFFEKRKQWILFAVADCTGHGVPGAFMSMLGIAYLNEIIARDEIITAADVLIELRRKLIHTLQQHHVQNSGGFELPNVKDGMDISFCALNTSTNELHYAGANNPVYIVSTRNISGGAITVAATETDNANVHEIKGDKQPIGVYVDMKPFSNHIVQLQEGDLVYLMSDGYEDQFGGPNYKKFYARNVKKLLAEVYALPLNEQRNVLETVFDGWRGDADQIDDVTILGIKC